MKLKRAQCSASYGLGDLFHLRPAQPGRTAKLGFSHDFQK